MLYQKFNFELKNESFFLYGKIGNLVLMIKCIGELVTLFIDYWASLANVKHHILLLGNFYDRCYKCKFMNSRPLCGIDGKTYQNKCMADCKGVVRVNNDYNVFLEVKNVSYKIFFFPIVEN